MKLLRYLRDGAWTPVFGYLLFVPLLGAGYYYNLTFVQLGLLDLGTTQVGMSRVAVSVAMAGLALLTVAVAVASGVLLDRTGASRSLVTKLRVLLAVLLVQLGLTAVAPIIGSSTAFYGWVAVCSLSLGVGLPTTFSLTTDLVPVRDRGYVAAAATAVAYFAAAVYPVEWRVEAFSTVMVVAMVPAVLLLAVLASGRLTVVDDLAAQHREFGVGRFCRPDPVRTRSLAFWSLVALLFGVFFVDSLGFLRIVETPVYVQSAWQSPDRSVHLFIGVVHVVGAAMAGVLYTNLDRRWLFLWVFGLFAFTHLLYTFEARTAPGTAPPLLLPGFYALVVSFYTTLTFALWPDLSTPDTIGTHTAVGVGVAGFLATFLSTAVALYFRQTGVTVVDHFTVVTALTLLLFVATAVGLYVRRMVALARSHGGWSTR